MSAKSTKKTRVNIEIKVKQVRLIGAEGDQLGVVGIHEALDAAKLVSLDLVEISPNAEPPVCRIMDYGKFLYQQKKKAVDAKKKQHQVEVREIRFRPVTDEGDYQVKLRNLIRFLDRGDKVKVTVRFRGRELAHREIGVELLKRVAEGLQEHGTVEQFPKMEGKQMVMALCPKKKSS